MNAMGLLVAGYLLMVLVVVPIVSRRTAASGLLTTLPRATLYRASMTTAWTLALIGAVVVTLSPTLTVTSVRLRGLPAGTFFIHLGATLAALTAGMLLIGWLRKSLHRPESRDLLHLLPRTGHERRLFWAVSLTAGITEEFVFRGIALTALASVMPAGGIPGPWVAAAIVSVAFGLGHGYQDSLGMLRAGCLGFLLAVPTLLTGSLLPGIVAHTLIDLIAGTPFGRLLVGPDDSDTPVETAGHPVSSTMPLPPRARPPQARRLGEGLGIPARKGSVVRTGRTSPRAPNTGARVAGPSLREQRHLL